MRIMTCPNGNTLTITAQGITNNSNRLENMLKERRGSTCHMRQTDVGAEAEVEAEAASAGWGGPRVGSRIPSFPHPVESTHAGADTWWEWGK